MATAEIAPNFSGPLGGVRQALKCCFVSAVVSPDDEMNFPYTCTHTHQTPILFQLKGPLLYIDPLQYKLVDQYHVTTAMVSIWMGDRLKIGHTTCFSSLETNSS